MPEQSFSSEGEVTELSSVSTEDEAIIVVKSGRREEKTQSPSEEYDTGSY